MLIVNVVEGFGIRRDTVSLDVDRYQDFQSESAAMKHRMNVRQKEAFGAQNVLACIPILNLSTFSDLKGYGSERTHLDFI